MNVLVLNCGSSTLKFRLFDVQQSREGGVTDRWLARGIAEPISAGDAGGRLKVRMADGSEASHEIPLPGHKEATRAVLAWLESSGLMNGKGLSAVGHRAVHGGQRFSQPVVVCEEVAGQLEELAELAPLHNRPALDAVRACRDSLGSSVPMVAIFDTAFHHTLPSCAAQYAIPRDLTSRLGIRRFGFHGIAHQQMAQRCAALLGKPLNGLRAVTLQLGNGCSATAVRGGQSIDTSMGLTPLEGLRWGLVRGTSIRRWWAISCGAAACPWRKWSGVSTPSLAF
jgi:acetate kinase